jgi:hypothetical protein
MLTVKDGPGFYRGFSLQLNLILLLIKEVKLREMVVRIFPDPDLLFVLPPPFPLSGTDPEKSSFCEIGMHDRMHGQDEILMLMIK